MKILIRTDFKHGRVAFKSGMVVEIPDRVGGYFIGVGWAKEAAEDAETTHDIRIEELAVDAPRVAKELKIDDVEMSVSTPAL